MAHDKIAVVDFGGQYAHLIATKVRRLCVLAEIRQPEDPIEEFREYKGIILSGSPALSAMGEESGYTKAVYDLPIPILGFCFGHQEIAKHYGGKVEHTRREYGPARLEIVGDSPLFKGLDPVEQVWMSHGDSVTELPEGFEEIGRSGIGTSSPHPNAAFANESLRRYGFQFHPEVDDTVHGDVMLRNFVHSVCGCWPDWTMDRYLQEQMDLLRRKAGDMGVFLLVSGGVDSTVCAVLLGKALGPDKLQMLHVDTGLMRKDESAEVMEELKRQGLSQNLHFIDASDRFLGALDGLTDPEKKRMAIGTTFIDIFRDEAERLDLSHMLLGQGTIYPDTIETGGTKRSDTIKTHHNRVQIIEEMISEGRVVEPLSELYKTEVRELGEALGISDSLVWRHPFPGPGLGVRLLCSDGVPPSLENEPESNARLEALLAPLNLSGRILPLMSVGVKGDLRSYERPVVIWGEVDHGRAVELAGRIYQEVPGVNRCVLDCTGEGFREVRLLPATVTRARLGLLQEADAFVMEALEKYGLMRTVWQCPTVLVPLEVNGRGRELVVLRPVLSERAMTARPAPLPEEMVRDLAGSILSLEGVSGLVLDVTTKPPGTIEWE